MVAVVAVVAVATVATVASAIPVEASGGERRLIGNIRAPLGNIVRRQDATAAELHQQERDVAG